MIKHSGAAVSPLREIIRIEGYLKRSIFRSAESVDTVLRVMKLAPDEMAAEFTSGGIEITAEDIENMTIEEFVMVMLGSAEIEIGDATINGETAVVPVTIEGETEQIQLVLENGRWVVVDDGVVLF